MACNKPKNAWEADDGSGLIFKWCPGIEVYAQPIHVDCGKCEGCRHERRRRVVAGLYCHTVAAKFDPLMVTWTVDNDHLIGDGKPHKDRIQKCFRSMRKAGLEFKHFSVAEFGDKTGREHFHSIVFPEGDWYPSGNHGDPLSCAARGLKFNNFMNGYVDPFFAKYWTHGIAFSAPVNPARLAYVAGYCGKKMGGRSERAMASKYLGVEALERFGQDWLRNGYVLIPGRNGKLQKFPVPRRFAAYLPDEYDDMKERKREFVDAAKPKTERQLESREINLLARQALGSGKHGGTSRPAHPPLKRLGR